MEEYPYPVTVAGEWGTLPPKTIKNKLQIYFQSKKKSGGGDCQVEYVGTGVTVRFKSEDVRKRVVAQEDHELAVESAKVKLRLCLYEETPGGAARGAGVDDTKPAEAGEGKGLTCVPGVQGEEPDGSAEPRGPRVVLLENVPEQLSQEMLGMMVETMCNVSEEKEDFSLEMIRNQSAAVVTFRLPSDAEQLLSRCAAHRRLQQQGLRARALGPSSSVRVEGLPPKAEAELLELYFEKERQGGGRVAAVTMIPEEQAAIITFQAPKVAETVLQRRHEICGVAVSVFRFLPELGAALYGRDRPEWVLPEAFSEPLHPALAAFLRQDRPLAALSAQMQPLFCRVEVGPASAELRPLPGLLSRPGLTPARLAAWRGEACRAFRGALAGFGCGECPVSAALWPVVEAEVRRAAGHGAVLLPDLPRGVVAVAGPAQDVERVRRDVAELVEQQGRQRDAVSEEIDLSPGAHRVLQLLGLQSSLAAAFPGLSLRYCGRARRLRLSGLPSEAYGGKSWVLERRLEMRQRPLSLAPELARFLSAADGEAVSRELFAARGLHAACELGPDGPQLLAASEAVLGQAERLLLDALASRGLEAEDPALLGLPEWAALKRSLAEPHGPSVCIREDGRGGVGVAGVRDAVRAVAEGLGAFLSERARVEEAVPMRSLALLLFLQEHKASAWSGPARAEQVSVRFQRARPPRVLLEGARLHVQGLKSLFGRLESGLCTEQLTIVKPGARKCFQEMEPAFSRTMKDRKCVVVLQEDEPDEGGAEEAGGAVCWRARRGGVLVTVEKADITRVAADAVVNAANEELRHGGGLALALLRAAGQQLQDASDAYVSANGPLRPGEAAVTPAGRLPCGRVIHAVGPRYSGDEHARCVQLLARAVGRSLALAEECGCASVALPAISAGLFGFPLPLCAETIGRAVLLHCSAPRPVPPVLARVRLVNHDAAAVRVLARALGEVFADGSPETSSQQSGPPAAGAEARRERPPPQAAEWSGPSERPQSSTEHRWDGPSDSSRELETKHTKEGLAIILRKGNIQDAATDVIVNTIALNLDLSQGAVSGAVLRAAGPQLQAAVLQAGRRGGAEYGDVLHTDGFRLNCDVLHTVCPSWDGDAGKAKKTLVHIVQTCLQNVEQRGGRSVAFPAIGTGNLGFPKTLVAEILLSEVQAFSQRRVPASLRTVLFVVHPSDTHTVECFMREFRGQGQRGPDRPPSSQERSPSGQSQPAFFGPVSSPALGVHKMDIGLLTLQVSSGDITREVIDVIVNSTNETFNLKTGVSKAILEAGGAGVEEECARLAYQPNRGLIVTRGGNLRCGKIVHIVVPSDPSKIRDLVLLVLQQCEDMKAGSVAFPALGTGQGNSKPTLVAEAMINAMADFARKKTERHLKFVKIVIFQTEMMSHFHKCMKKKEGGGPPVEKNLFTKAIEAVGSFFLGASGESRPGAEPEAEPVLEGEELLPAVFQLCGETTQGVVAAREELKRLLMKEQMERFLEDPAIGHLSQGQRRALLGLQRTLAVRVQLEAHGRAPRIRLEGLTRDVLTAEDQIRGMIREAAAGQRRRTEALRLHGRVEWQYEDTGRFLPFDLLANLMLEEAFQNQQSLLRIHIHGSEFEADLASKTAYGDHGERITLNRREINGSPQSPWSGSGGPALQVATVQQGSVEYQRVEAQFKGSGLSHSIVEIGRIENDVLQAAYETKKGSLDRAPGHRNREWRLFHCSSPAYIKQINKQGFHHSKTGPHAGPYGKGIYFAVDPITALKTHSIVDPQGYRHMYLALVLPGEYTKGDPTMVSPPQMNSGKPADFYDSVVDNPAKPSVFVIFDGVQAFPQYLIKLK